MKRVNIRFTDGGEFRGVIGTGREIKSLWNGMARRGFYHTFSEPMVNVDRVYGMDLDGMDVCSSETLIRMMIAGDTE